MEPARVRNLAIPRLEHPCRAPPPDQRVSFALEVHVLRVDLRDVVPVATPVQWKQNARGIPITDHPRLHESWARKSIPGVSRKHLKGSLPINGAYQPLRFADVVLVSRALELTLAVPVCIAAENVPTALRCSAEYRASFLPNVLSPGAPTLEAPQIHGKSLLAEGRKFHSVSPIYAQAARDYLSGLPSSFV